MLYYTDVQVKTCHTRPRNISYLVINYTFKYIFMFHYHFWQSITVIKISHLSQI